MSELQDALKDWESLGSVRQQELGWMLPLVEHARLVANPNIKAMARRLAEDREGMAEFPPDSFDLELAGELWALALTPGDTK